MSDRYSSAQEEGKLNQIESEFGAPMSVVEIAQHFNVPVPESPKIPELPKTMDELDALQKKLDNANDIYKIKARVSNLARSGGASLTAVGEGMCNAYVHVLFDLYAYAESINDQKLIDLIRKHEDFPANVISASGVKTK